MFFFAGGSAKTLLLVTVCPTAASLTETISSLNFASRVRNAVPSLGNRDTIKKWRDTVCLISWKIWNLNNLLI